MNKTLKIATGIFGADLLRRKNRRRGYMRFSLC